MSSIFSRDANQRNAELDENKGSTTSLSKQIQFEEKGDEALFFAIRPTGVELITPIPPRSVIKRYSIYSDVININ